MGRLQMMIKKAGQRVFDRIIKFIDDRNILEEENWTKGRFNFEKLLKNCFFRRTVFLKICVKDFNCTLIYFNLSVLYIK